MTFSSKEISLFNFISHKYLCTKILENICNNIIKLHLLAYKELRRCVCPDILRPPSTKLTTPTPSCVLCDTILQLYNDKIIQQYNDISIQRYNNTIIQQNTWIYLSSHCHWDIWHCGSSCSTSTPQSSPCQYNWVFQQCSR